MGFFSVDGKQAGGFEPITNGEYECIISEAEVGVSGNNNPKISIVLTVREDVEQEFQKRKIFDNLTQTEAAMFKFHNLSKALEFEDGSEFDTLEEFAQSIIYKPVRVLTKLEEYNGRENAKVVTFKVSEHGFAGSTSAAANPLAGNNKGAPAIDISDDDLPF